MNRSAGDVVVRPGQRVTLFWSVRELGIGVGLVVGGEVFRGATDIAGEFGHMTIVAGGKSCPCGNLGCWERYASAASAVELYRGETDRARHNSPLRFTDLVSRAHAGERRAQVTLDRVGTHLGIGIGNVICGLRRASRCVEWRSRSRLEVHRGTSTSRDCPLTRWTSGQLVTGRRRNTRI